MLPGELGRLQHCRSLVRRTSLAASGDVTTTIRTRPNCTCTTVPYSRATARKYRCGRLPSCRRLPSTGSCFGGPGTGGPLFVAAPCVSLLLLLLLMKKRQRRGMRKSGDIHGRRGANDDGLGREGANMESYTNTIFSVQHQLLISDFHMQHLSVLTPDSISTHAAASIINNDVVGQAPQHRAGAGAC